MMCCQNMVVFHNIFLNTLIDLVDDASFKSNTDGTSHLELSNTENVSLSTGYAKFLLAILTFKCLESVTTLLSCVTFLLINITGLE